MEHYLDGVEEVVEDELVEAPLDPNDTSTAEEESPTPPQAG